MEVTYTSDYLSAPLISSLFHYLFSLPLLYLLSLPSSFLSSIISPFISASNVIEDQMSDRSSVCFTRVCIMRFSHTCVCLRLLTLV
eukprot:m.39033 g.39033  ORF g.39033 m.39033 type:complete len:86 (-) comp11553_c0_seq1:284-541(-)